MIVVLPTHVLVMEDVRGTGGRGCVLESWSELGSRVPLVRSGRRKWPLHEGKTVPLEFIFIDAVVFSFLPSMESPFACIDETEKKSTWAAARKP